MTIHLINGTSPQTSEPVVEWQLVCSAAMGGPVLQARSPGGEWQCVLAIDGDGLLDPTFSPTVEGVPINDAGYIDCVESYPTPYCDEDEDEELVGERVYTFRQIKDTLRRAGINESQRHEFYCNLPAKGE